MTQTLSLRSTIVPVLLVLLAACGGDRTSAIPAPRVEMVAPEPAAPAAGESATPPAQPAEAREGHAGRVGAAAPATSSTATAPEPPASAGGDFGIVAATFTHGVEARQPVDQARAFSVGERATLHLVVKNLGAPRDVTVEWLRDETVLGRTTLSVGTSPSWRTWAYRRIGTRDVESGVQVRVVDEAGTVLHEGRIGVTNPGQPTA